MITPLLLLLFQDKLLAKAPDIARPLLLDQLSLVDALPWVPMDGGLVHAAVISGDFTLCTTDNEEEFGETALVAAVLPKALAALHLFVLGAGKAVAVLLAQHRDGPVAAVEAVARGILAVAKQRIELKLHSARQLADAIVEIPLVRLWTAAEQARRETPLTGGVIALHGG